MNKTKSKYLFRLKNVKDTLKIVMVFGVECEDFFYFSFGVSS